MRIRVKLFASLRERFGYGDTEVELEQGQTIADVWRAVAPGHDMPDNVLMALNMNYVKPDTQVSEGDEVAFFPPVTGG